MAGFSGLGAPGGGLAWFGGWLLLALALGSVLVLVSPPALAVEGSPALSGSEQLLQTVEGRPPGRLVRSFRELRYTGVVGQTDWFTCGAAAVATLLTYYYADPTGEGEVLEVAVRETERSGEDPREGLTALSLKRYLEGEGYGVLAYRVALAGLADYFGQGGLPVVAHVTKPEFHFVVVAGLVPDPLGGPPQVLLADPSWGRRILPLEALVTEKGFSGVILLALPQGQAQLVRVLALQGEGLAWAGAELSRLRRLAGAMFRDSTVGAAGLGR